MKKFLALLLAAMMALSCTAFAAAEEVDADLLAAAKAEGELIVYGSAEEAYVSAACKHFEELYGIKVSYQRPRKTAIPAPMYGSAAPPIPMPRPLPPVCCCPTRRRTLLIWSTRITATRTALGTASIRAFWASWSTPRSWPV